MERVNVSPQAVRDRGLNLLLTAGLVIAGVAFGLPVFREAEVADKLDDYALLAVAAIALVWYRLGRVRFRRSAVPLALVALAVAVQMIGVAIERDDAGAVGDNANALFVLVPLLGVGLWEYVRPLKLSSGQPEE